MIDTPTKPVLTRPADLGLPRILVADDDPASRLFLADALRKLGMDVEACADGTEAIEYGRRESFDMLLLDCRMPGAGAEQVLTALRNDAQAGSTDSIAVATSAELDTATRQRLLAHGFSDALLKPCELVDLHRIIALAKSGMVEPPLLDDKQALASTGDTQIMQALRGLLHDELATLHQELDQLSNEPEHLAERLHRLRSSCGFCGATALASETIQLQRHLKMDQGDAQVFMTRFRTALLATIKALKKGHDI
ncbi:response regulator [Dyella tabacisoli]|uniref:Response regulator n=1 Tax=Dyella tabacisoli TaxID=2282381 RepID=A0A369UU81_9GAMM|nr:response regulator [Dyella tabacisoli]RDD83278.1 response regulator [Dyella tabacisoli]